MLVNVALTLHLLHTVSHFLYVASHNNNEWELVDKLLDNGADYDLYNNEGQTALILAASDCGNVDRTQLLVDIGADIGIVDNYGNTACYYNRCMNTEYIIPGCTGCSSDSDCDACMNGCSG